MAETANTELFDALVRHQIYLMRLSGSVRNDILKLLDDTESDIRDKLLAQLPDIDLETTLGQKRLGILLEAIATTRETAFKKVDETWLKHMVELAQKEPEFVAGLIQTVSPVVLDMLLPSAEELTTIVRSKPFEGRILKEWADTIRDADIKRISDNIKIGLVQGEDTKTIARRIIGSAELDGGDGVTEITRRQATAITRTAVNHVTNQAKRELYKANADILSEELYVATLDSRTTPVCRANDGKTFPIGEGPIPPLHYNCRSLRVAIIDGNVIGNRPFKSSTDAILKREYADENDIELDGGELPRGHKGAFDKFARQRIRELTGTTPATTSYQTFLKRQSEEFQDEVLGKTKAKLFRDGDLPLDRFVNRQGDELTLSQLAKKHADAFRAAGLDPEDYL